MMDPCGTMDESGARICRMCNEPQPNRGDNGHRWPSLGHHCTAFSVMVNMFLRPFHFRKRAKSKSGRVNLARMNGRGRGRGRSTHLKKGGGEQMEG